jgi:hypothetical protein
LTATPNGFNPLDRENDDIVRVYRSRLPGDPLDGVANVHFHPTEKPSTRISLTWRY